MKHQQVRTVLVVWAFFIVATGLFPPLEYNYSIEAEGIKFEESGMSTRYSYRFILNTPPVNGYIDGLNFENNRSYSNLQLWVLAKANTDYFIDLRRLFVIWTSISVIFGTVFLFAYNNAVNADKVEQLFYKSQRRREKEQAKKNNKLNEIKEPQNEK